jgi:hypothetical protein
MANRHFNKQTTHTRQALARGGSAKKPKRKPSPQKPDREILGGTGPTRPRPIRPIKPEKM